MQVIPPVPPCSSHSPFPGEFTCWAHWKILHLDPKTLPGLILLQRREQLGRRRGDSCRLHWARWGLVARAAAGVTAGNGTERRTGECMKQSHQGNYYLTRKVKFQSFCLSTGFLPSRAWFCFCAAAHYSHKFKSLPTNIPLQSPQRRQAGKWNMGKMSVRSSWSGGDSIKCNAMLDQLRSCVGRVEKYKENAQVWQCLKIPPGTLTYRKEILLCSQASSLKRSVLQRDHVWKSWQVFWSTAWE